MYMCRTCLSDANLTPIFMSGDVVNRKQHLLLVTGLEILPNDGLPQWMCSDCNQMVLSSLKLRESSSKAHKILSDPSFLQINTQKGNSQTLVKVEPLDTSEAIKSEHVDANAWPVGIKQEIDIENEPWVPGDPLKNTEPQEMDRKPIISEVLVCELNEALEQGDDPMGNSEPHENSEPQGTGNKELPAISEVLPCEFNEIPEQNSDPLENESRLLLGKVVPSEPPKPKLVPKTNKTKIKTPQAERMSPEFIKKLMTLAVTPYSKKEPIQCKVCSKVLQTYASFKKHAHAHIAVERAYECEQCSKKFHTRRRLLRHKTSHMVYTYYCYKCPQTYKIAESVKYHLTLEHCIEKKNQLPIKCDKVPKD